MTRGRAALAGAGALAGLLVAAAPASAHGLVGKQDLPIPRWLFAWAATVVLVVSFVALAALWRTPRLEGAGERELLQLPRALDPVCGAVGVAAFGFAVYAGLAGAQNPSENVLPTVVFVVFWVGLPIVSALAGDVFRAFNPWRAIARFAGWTAARLSGRRPPAPIAYPPWLGRWPAALGVLGFVWVELAYVDRDDPSALAILAVGYAAFQLVGMSLFGVRAWSDRADTFGVYFGLFARLAPLRWHSGRLFVRPPLAGVATLEPLPGTVALLCAMIGTTSFDGFTQGPAWRSLAPDLQQRFLNLGLSANAALELTFTVGLVVMVLAVAGFYLLGAWGVRTAGGGDVPGLAARFAPSLVPIALAYVIAHYVGLLAYQGQAMAFLASDPLGDGWDLLGTATATIDYGWISASAIWYIQVAVLVVGHACALALAHDRALVTYADVGVATRSQYWMLAVMVGFTSLALWLLSAGS